MAAGRKRSEESREAILAAARALSTETGYEKLSIEAIARAAGVGKQTIYRWWPSKSAVLADAMLSAGPLAVEQPLPDTGEIVADLSTWVHDWVHSMRDNPARLDGILALSAAAMDDQAVADRVAVAAAPHDNAVVARLRIARAAGQLEVTASERTVSETLTGFVMLRVMSRQGLPSDEELDAVVRLVVGRG